jgi:glutathione peroxidase
MSVYDFTAKDIDGNEVNLKDYEGKALLIVNTASECGFTPQYEDLQKLYELYQDKGLEILGFPCNQFKGQEPGNSDDIQKFCQINYGVTFKIFEKVKVNGENAHPLFKYLKAQAPYEGWDENHPTNKILASLLKENYPEYLMNNEIRWNFTKFLVNPKGQVVERFESSVSPLDMEGAIEKVLP